MTTRNKKVAEVMQTTACLSPTYLPEDSCWQLFQHYAFSGTSDTGQTHKVDMGMEIMRKCCGLPLAVKSIASLLRHETHEECWREILESDLWELNPSNDIFSALQISYAHLPAHLKPCFLFCSMYPKDYVFEKINLIELWISHGYIESRRKKTITEIGIEYYEELKGRSFLDDFSGESSDCCKLHDIVHDLARLNSENEHYSVQINQPLDNQERIIMQEAYHLHVRGFAGYTSQILQQNLKGLRTLSTDLRGCNGDLEHQYCKYFISNTLEMDLHLNITKFEELRVLELKGYRGTKIPDSISQLKHLVYLCITSFCLKMLPTSIGLLYNLQTLILDCPFLEYLPGSIGDLPNLLRLAIGCDYLQEVPIDLKHLCNLNLRIDTSEIQPLPNTIGCLSSLEELNFVSWIYSLDKGVPLHGFENTEVDNGKLDYVPHGLVNFPAIKAMRARLRVRTIAWLKDMNDLEGKLSIEGLINISNLVDAQCANLRNMCKLETLDLCWYPEIHIVPYSYKSELI
ncbi:putative disease resistance protein RGA1 isoform X2 [Carex rostrata]